MKFTASRLSEGNNLFPAQITVEEDGLIVKIPGFLSGKSTHLPFEHITSVSVDSPMVGYSTLRITAQGTRITVHGFSKGDAEQIRTSIFEGQGFNDGEEVTHEYEPESVKLKRLEIEERENTKALEEEATRLRYRSSDDIGAIKFGQTQESIISEIDQMMSNLKTLVGSVNYNKKYSTVTTALAARIEEGIKKLKRFDSSGSLPNEFTKELETLLEIKKRKDKTARMKSALKFIIPICLWAISIQLWRIRHMRWWLAALVTVAVVGISVFYFLPQWLYDDSEISE